MLVLPHRASGDEHSGFRSQSGFRVRVFLRLRWVFDSRSARRPQGGRRFSTARRNIERQGRFRVRPDRRHQRKQRGRPEPVGRHRRSSRWNGGGYRWNEHRQRHGRHRRRVGQRTDRTRGTNAMRRDTVRGAVRLLHGNARMLRSALRARGVRKARGARSKRPPALRVERALRAFRVLRHERLEALPDDGILPAA
jgi:hypothetical protein